MYYSNSLTADDGPKEQDQNNIENNTYADPSKITIVVSAADVECDDDAKRHIYDLPKPQTNEEKCACTDNLSRHIYDLPRLDVCDRMRTENTAIPATGTTAARLGSKSRLGQGFQMTLNGAYAESVLQL